MQVASSAVSAVSALSADEIEVCGFLEALKNANASANVSANVSANANENVAVVSKAKTAVVPQVKMSVEQMSNTCRRLQSWPTHELWSFAVVCIVAGMEQVEMQETYKQHFSVSLSTPNIKRVVVPRSRDHETTPYNARVASVGSINVIDAWCIADICITIAMHRPYVRDVCDVNRMLLNMYFKVNT
jgi:hypothetical protein